MNSKLASQVRSRAGNRCEYCHIPESAETLKQVLDHIVAEQHHGPTSFENLAQSCGHCNRNKGPNLSGIDPVSGRHVALLHPRHDLWTEHFYWEEAQLLGKTAKGRATIDVLKINDELRVGMRRRLNSAGKYPLLNDDSL